jgi:hypothetical protein
MPDSTPPSRSRLDPPRDIADDPAEDRPSARESQARRPLRLIDQGATPSRPSLASGSAYGPPSEPRPIPGRPGADASPDRPARVQLIAALLLLLVLVVVPLYLWRRPRAAATEETAKNAAALALASAQVADTVAPAPTDTAAHVKDGVTISDTTIAGCHDTGSRRTAATACDRLPELEAAIGKAVLDNAACVAPGTPAATIAFKVDASYARHKSPIHVTYVRGRTTMASKIAASCAAEVKKSLAMIALDPTHAHARYELTIDATYKR